MKSKRLMRAGFLLAIICTLGLGISTISRAAAGTVSDETLQYRVNELSTKRFIFEAVSPKIQIKRTVENRRTFQKLAVPGGVLHGDVGKPALPGFTRLVVVPTGAKINVKVQEGEPQIYKGLRIYPVQKQLEDSVGSKEPSFTIDKKFYSMNLTYPKQLVKIEYDWIRSCKVALVHVTTARYNPYRKRLIYYPELEIDIQFEGGEEDFIPMEKRSRFFEAAYSKVFANYAVAEVNIRDLYELWFLGYDLLIVTHDDFETQANTLAAWKRKKGLRTKVATLSDIEDSQGDTTADSIRAYIKDLYEAKNLSYVLLLGDAEFIPPHYITPHPTAHGGTLMGTDLYYAEMDYAGYFPDLAIGRIPVDTDVEAQIVIDKIISYEKFPPWNMGFYNSILLAGYFQDDDNNGRADREFAETVEEIRDYFNAEGFGHLPREYTTNSTNPRWYRDGSAVPGALSMPGFAWDGSADGIIDEINAGTFLVIHRDHGSRNGWGDPDFRTWDLADLDNRNLLPVTLSINCQTGWFDNETDDAILNTGINSESFAEEFLRMEGGSVAIIAATRNSPSYPNNDLTFAFVDSIWNDMLLEYPTVADTDASALEGSHRLGDALNYAKFYVATQWMGISARQRPFEIYHVLGDPTMEIWTDYPHLILVEFPYFEEIKPFEWEYWFPIKVEGVIAALIQNGEIIGQALSEKGGVNIKLSKPLAISKDTVISLSKKGYTTQTVPLSFTRQQSLNTFPKTLQKPMRW